RRADGYCAHCVGASQDFLRGVEGSNNRLGFSSSAAGVKDAAHTQPPASNRDLVSDRKPGFRGQLVSDQDVGGSSGRPLPIVRGPFGRPHPPAVHAANSGCESLPAIAKLLSEISADQLSASGPAISGHQSRSVRQDGGDSANVVSPENAF